ncbi:GyrI-like domain-containing protein [Kribbella sp. NPDC050470]|uniref:GyrI-like domain-containing protein n=1 Tax=unclassified Kribbella TaxID=2644121 RepID=UPI0037A3774F
MHTWQTRTFTEQATAVRRAVVPTGLLADWVPRACVEVGDWLYRQGTAPCGYPFARHHPLHDGLVDVEAGFPVAVPIIADGLIEPSALPGGPVLVVRYAGPYEQIGTVQQTIDDWLHEEDADRAGESWEVYRDLSACDRIGRRIEVVQPITFAHVLV